MLKYIASYVCHGKEGQIFLIDYAALHIYKYNTHKVLCTYAHTYIIYRAASWTAKLKWTEIILHIC